MAGSLGGMTQEFPDSASELAPHPTHMAASERVGVPEVDAVLEEIESVGELPVGEQVAVFERAHEQLRQALAQA